MSENRTPWQPPTTNDEANKTAAMMYRIARYDLEGKRLLKTAAKVGVYTEADFDAASDWTQSHLANLTFSESVMLSLRSIKWRLSLPGLFWLVVGVAIMFGTFEALGIIGVLVGLALIAHAAFRFAGFHPRALLRERLGG